MQPNQTTYDYDTKIWSGRPVNVKFDLSQSVGKLLLDALAVYPDKVIQINHDNGYEMSSKELRQKAIKFARQLPTLDVNRGDYVTVIARNSDNLVPFVVGTILAGVIMNPLDVQYSYLEITHFIKLVQPKMIVCEESVLATVQRVINENKLSAKILVLDEEETPASDQYLLSGDVLRGFEKESPDFEVPPIRDEDEVIFIYNSSGTTGLPKGVCLNHVATASSMQLTMNQQMNQVSKSFTFSSLVWFTGISFILYPIVNQGIRIITKQTSSAKLALEIFNKHKISFFFCEPTLFGDIARFLDENPNHNYDLTSLRLMVTGGSRVARSVVKLMKKGLPRVLIANGYGATEINGGIAHSMLSEENAVGHLGNGLQVKLVDEDNTLLGHDKEGEIYAKTNFKVLHYLNNDEANREAFTEDGWYRTGDVGYFDKDNCLYLTGRKKFIFKYRNNHISPAEIESFLTDTFSEDIIGICVVPIPHDVGGNLVSVVILRAPNSQLTELQVKKAVEDNFSDAKRLRGGVYFVDSLPLTASGKIRLSEVKDLAFKLFQEQENAK